MKPRLGLILVLAPALVAAALGHAESYRAPTAMAADDRLKIGARSARAPVYRGQQPAFLVGFQNTSSQPLSLPVTSYLGVDTIGVFQYEIEERSEGIRFRVGLDPHSPLPATAPRTTHVTVDPADTYRLSVMLPGPGKLFWPVTDGASSGQPLRELPPGRYALHLTMRLPSEIVALGPVLFTVKDQPPPAAARPTTPSRSAVRAAEAFLADRLALHRRANPTARIWRVLRPSSFTSSSRYAAAGWKIEYRAEMAAERKVFQLTVTVSNDGKILSPESDFRVASSAAAQPRR